MKSLFRILFMILCLAMLCSTAFAAQMPDLPDLVQEANVTEDDPNYWHDLVLAEIHNMKYLRSIPTAFEKEGWEAYNRMSSTILGCDPDTPSDKKLKKVLKAVETRRAMVQIKSLTDCCWMLWEDQMPCAKDMSTVEFKLSDFDTADFKPFLLPYLQADQSAVKGNIIVVAGGGNVRRANDKEGYNIAEYFYGLGYNSYVLQRRLKPYANADTFIDLQRAIRYIRYHAEEYGLGGMDCIAAAGFSGGSATVMGVVTHLYGDVQPTIYDPSYVPDAIDALSSDLDAVATHYGPNADYESDYQGLVTDNANLPDIFACAGDLDGASTLVLRLAQSVREKTRLEVHIWADTEHGYGDGTEGTNSVLWMDMFDSFLTHMNRNK